MIQGSNISMSQIRSVHLPHKKLDLFQRYIGLACNAGCFPSVRELYIFARDRFFVPPNGPPSLNQRWRSRNKDGLPAKNLQSRLTEDVLDFLKQQETKPRKKFL